MSGGHNAHWFEQYDHCEELLVHIGRFDRIAAIRERSNVRFEHSPQHVQHVAFRSVRLCEGIIFGRIRDRPSNGSGNERIHHGRNTPHRPYNLKPARDETHQTHDHTNKLSRIYKGQRKR